MSRIMLAFGLMAVGATALAQQNPVPPVASTQPAPAASSASSPLKPGDRHCIRNTGSIIPAKPGRCLPVEGNSYSREEIESTGATTVGGALQRLDPDITVRGGGH